MGTPTVTAGAQPSCAPPVRVAEEHSAGVVVAAGFVASLPLSTMILLPLVQRQHQSVATTVSVAKAICIALPVTLIFFVPFFLAKRLGLSFWQAYSLGAFGLVPAFFLHRLILKLL